MEEWQKEHIKDNLPALIEMTVFNERVKATLLSENILGKSDISSLVSAFFKKLINNIDSGLVSLPISF